MVQPYLLLANVAAGIDRNRSFVAVLSVVLRRGKLARSAGLGELPTGIESKGGGFQLALAGAAARGGWR